MFVTLLVLKLPSVYAERFPQPANIKLISATFDVSNLETSIAATLQFSNMPFIFVTLLVLSSKGVVVTLKSRRFVHPENM